MLRPYLSTCPFLTQDNDSPGGFVYSPEESLKTSLGLTVPVGTSLARSNGHVIITVKNASLTIEERRLDDLRKSARHLDLCIAHIDLNHAFIALYNEYASHFPILCLDSRSGKVLWRTQARALGAENLGFRTGPPWLHEPIIVPIKTTVAVFGTGAGGAYLDAFDRESGKPLYHFATNYWYYPH
jgi:hypothetical protein